MPAYTSDSTGPSVDNQGEPESSAASERIGIRRRLTEGVRQHDVSGLSAEIAYRFLFAVFPFGLFVAALGAFVAGVLFVDKPAQLGLNRPGGNPPPALPPTPRPPLGHPPNTPPPGGLRV